MKMEVTEAFCLGWAIVSPAPIVNVTYPGTWDTNRTDSAHLVFSKSKKSGCTIVLVADRCLHMILLPT